MSLNLKKRPFFGMAIVPLKLNYVVLLLAMLTFSSRVHCQNQQTTESEKPKEFKPSGKVWGYVFGDYFLKVHSDSLNRGNTQYSNIARNFNAFSFRRIYLGYDYQISRTFSTQLLLANENDNSDAQGERTVYIKAANLRWKNILPNNDLVIGQTATPIFALLSESVWGYRSIEKTVTDMRKLNSSNDFGLLWQGKLNAKGDYGYNFMIANGTAQKPENDKYKKIYSEIYAKIFDQKLILDITGDFETSGPGKSKTGIRGFVAYQSKAVHGGFEIYSQTQKAATSDTTLGVNQAVNLNIVPFAMSFFIRGEIIPDKLNYFARFDHYNPDNKFNPSIEYSTKVATDKQDFITAGIDWMPVKNVHLMPNIWFNSYNSMKNNVSGKALSDYDMAARITFYYIFRPND